MICHTQSDIKTISKYLEWTKERTAKCAEMENPVLSWLQSSFFWLGPNSNMEPYTFQMVNNARSQKQELEIDKMIIALIDHDRRLEFSKETKALATKQSHKNNSEKKNLQKIFKPSSSALDAKTNRGKGPCNYCGSAHHKKMMLFSLSFWQKIAWMEAIYWKTAFFEKEYGLQKNSQASQVNESCTDCQFSVD